MQLIVIAHNIRSAHNVGAIFRTCEGFGVERLILSGYTPYPEVADDTRLPHEVRALTKQIDKTALGATEMLPFEHIAIIEDYLDQITANGWQLVALEQAPHSIPLPDFHPSDKVCLLLGEEVHGITADLLARADAIVEIPMQGSKESFNVSVATGIALYALTT